MPSPRAAQRSALLLALLLSLIHHLWALDATPLEAIDEGGAEYIPHLQRLLARGLMPFDVWPPWQALLQLDGHYGGLLHILGALWGGLGPEHSDALALPWASHLSWLSLAATALGVHALGQRLSPAPWAGSLGALLVLALPGLMFPAQRYYYDLPMAAALTWAGVHLLAPRREGWASLCLGSALAGIALLFKWAAGLYLIPLGLVYILSTRGEPRRWLRVTVATAITTLITAPLLLNSGGSAAFQLGLLGLGDEGAGLSPGLALSRGVAYGRAWFMDGTGPLLGLGVIAMVPWVPRPKRRALGGVILLPLVCLILGLSTPDGRYILPLLPAFALLGGLGSGALIEGRGPWAMGVAIALIAGQSAWATGLIMGPSPQEALQNWARHSPDRHWWYGGGRARHAAPVTEDKSLAQGISALCTEGPLYVLRGRPHDLPVHPLRYWLLALGSPLDVRVNLPPGAPPGCILTPQKEAPGLGLLPLPGGARQVRLQGRGGAPIILTMRATQ